MPASATSLPAGKPRIASSCAVPSSPTTRARMWPIVSAPYRRRAPSGDARQFSRRQARRGNRRTIPRAPGSRRRHMRIDVPRPRSFTLDAEHRKVEPASWYYILGKGHVGGWIGVSANRAWCALRGHGKQCRHRQNYRHEDRWSAVWVLPKIRIVVRYASPAAQSG